MKKILKYRLERGLILYGTPGDHGVVIHRTPRTIAKISTKIVDSGILNGYDDDEDHGEKYEREYHVDLVLVMEDNECFYDFMSRVEKCWNNVKCTDTYEVLEKYDNY